MAASTQTERIVKAIERITEHVQQRGEPLFHYYEQPLPQKREVIAILRGLQEVIYPGYFGDQTLYREYLPGHLGDQLFTLGKQLEREVGRALTAQCRVPGGEALPQPSLDAREVIAVFFEQLPEVMGLVASDVRAAYQGDPAATCIEESFWPTPA